MRVSGARHFLGRHHAERAALPAPGARLLAPPRIQLRVVEAARVLQHRSLLQAPEGRHLDCDSGGAQAGGARTSVLAVTAGTASSSRRAPGPQQPPGVAPRARPRRCAWRDDATEATLKPGVDRPWRSRCRQRAPSSSSSPFFMPNPSLGPRCSFMAAAVRGSCPHPSLARHATPPAGLAAAAAPAAAAPRLALAALERACMCLARRTARCSTSGPIGTTRQRQIGSRRAPSPAAAGNSHQQLVQLHLPLHPPKWRTPWRTFWRR